MKRNVVIAAILACVSFSQAAAAEAEKPVLSVARITSTIQEGQKWGELGGGILSLPEAPLEWNTGPGKLNIRAFEAPARLVLKQLGFAISGDPSDPFDDKTADLAIGGTITAIHGDFCGRRTAFDQGISGSASIEIDWQLYSTIERKTLARVHTSGDAKSGGSQKSFSGVLITAMDDCLRKCAASDEFKGLISTRQAATAAAAPSGTLATKTAISLTGSAKAQPMRISDAVGSVVLVLSGEGHGSGFLVSSDGYLLTAQHVVGSDKYVKIRWSDGLEGVGEVIRTDKRRDVALIKTDPRGRQPLALHRVAPQPGETVFAIGAPLDVKFQSTVTRGVASANRIMDGFSFIQSDVTISPCNSGGPLLDEKGEVIGICDLTFRPGGEDVPSGINYFVPIDDALRFLSAEPQ